MLRHRPEKTEMSHWRKLQVLEIKPLQLGKTKMSCSIDTRDRLRRDKQDLDAKLRHLEDSYRQERKTTVERHDLELRDKVKQTEDDVMRQLFSRHANELKQAEETSQQNMQAVKKRLETEHSNKLAKTVEELRSQLEAKRSDEVRHHVDDEQHLNVMCSKDEPV